MKSGILGVAALALLCGASAGRADETQYGRLTYAAHDLTYAAQELVKTVDDVALGSSVAADAETLFDSTEHFTEEVDLGPQDLDVDFDTIETVFDTVRGELLASQIVQSSEPARTAWFEVEEANIRLREAWSTSGFATTTTSGYQQCTAANTAGQTFIGVGATAADAQGTALEYCRASAAGTTCVVGTCTPYQG